MNKVERVYEWIKIVCDYDKKSVVFYIEDDEIYPLLEELQQGKIKIASYGYLNGEGELKEGVKIIIES